jgi:hypothetical protein
VDGVCPACWPAYAGILGSLGLGFLLDSTSLLPVTVALFGLVGASVWNTWPRRRNEVGCCPKGVQQQPAIENKSAR